MNDDKPKAPKNHMKYGIEYIEIHKIDNNYD